MRDNGLLLNLPRNRRTPKQNKVTKNRMMSKRTSSSIRITISRQLKINLINLRGLATSESRETTLHLCVRYNSIGALKLLVESMTEDEVVQCVDEDGNTLLHVAVVHQQIEVRAL